LAAVADNQLDRNESELASSASACNILGEQQPDAEKYRECFENGSGLAEVGPPQQLPPAPPEPPPQRHEQFLQLARRYIIPATNKVEGLRLGFDAEANDLLNAAAKVHCIAIADLDRDGTADYGPGQINDALAHLSRANYLVGHNIVGYDLPLLRRLYGWTPSQGCVVVDTLITSRLILPHLSGLDGQATAMGDSPLGSLGCASRSSKDWRRHRGLGRMDAGDTGTLCR
jgi:hypothetical protein